MNIVMPALLGQPLLQMKIFIGAEIMKKCSNKQLENLTLTAYGVRIKIPQSFVTVVLCFQGENRRDNIIFFFIKKSFYRNQSCVTVSVAHC